ncbi:hypothetical protein T439DRAFT_345937 [Meredithblackwellia eburnea MCA 4105]
MNFSKSFIPMDHIPDEPECQLEYEDYCFLLDALLAKETIKMRELNLGFLVKNPDKFESRYRAAYHEPNSHLEKVCKQLVHSRLLFEHDRRSEDISMYSDEYWDRLNETTDELEEELAAIRKSERGRQDWAEEWGEWPGEIEQHGGVPKEQDARGFFPKTEQKIMKGKTSQVQTFLWSLTWVTVNHEERGYFTDLKEVLEESLKDGEATTQDFQWKKGDSKKFWVQWGEVHFIFEKPEDADREHDKIQQFLAGLDWDKNQGCFKNKEKKIFTMRYVLRQSRLNNAAETKTFRDKKSQRKFYVRNGSICWVDKENDAHAPAHELSLQKYRQRLSSRYSHAIAQDSARKM